ncbi:DUF4917 family protein [uncultured Pseudomonas sp.]|uniref:DUF4917 family protein n=1 Tax=uncultured Pseudomonas sp. TaxID=114707 RepID=UPI00338DD2AF
MNTLRSSIAALLGGQQSAKRRHSEERKNFSQKLRFQLANPHGGLALCRNTVEQESKIHTAGAGLLGAIQGEWRGKSVVPPLRQRSSQSAKGLPRLSAAFICRRCMGKF